MSQAVIQQDPKDVHRYHRVMFVDTRDEAMLALRKYEEADQVDQRLEDELASAVGFFELELGEYVDGILPPVEEVIERSDWTPEQHAQRIRELEEMFQDLGFGELVEP